MYKIKYIDSKGNKHRIISDNLDFLNFEMIQNIDIKKIGGINKMDNRMEVVKKENKIPICRWVGEFECLHMKGIFCTAGFKLWKRCSDLEDPFKGEEVGN